GGRPERFRPRAAEDEPRRQPARGATREPRGHLHGARPARRIRPGECRNRRGARADRTGQPGGARMTTATTAMNSRAAALRAGLSRGWIETRQNSTETAYLFGHALP